MTGATPPSRWSPLAGRNTLTDLSCELSERSPPTLPESLLVPTNRGNTSERESSLLADDGDSPLFTPQDLVVDGHATEYFIILSPEDCETHHAQGRQYIA
jgi:hypothetical protein